MPFRILFVITGCFTFIYPHSTLIDRNQSHLMHDSAMRRSQPLYMSPSKKNSYWTGSRTFKLPRVVTTSPSNQKKMRTQVKSWKSFCFLSIGWLKNNHRPLLLAPTRSARQAAHSTLGLQGAIELVLSTVADPSQHSQRQSIKWRMRCVRNEQKFRVENLPWFFFCKHSSIHENDLLLTIINSNESIVKTIIRQNKNQ